jgi:hypothetical protein
LAYAHAFFWKRTGEAKYFRKAVRHLGGRASQWMQRFGNYGRSKLYGRVPQNSRVPRFVRKSLIPCGLVLSLLARHHGWV